MVNLSKNLENQILRNFHDIFPKISHLIDFIRIYKCSNREKVLWGTRYIDTHRN